MDRKDYHLNYLDYFIRIFIFLENLNKKENAIIKDPLQNLFHTATALPKRKCSKHSCQNKIDIESNIDPRQIHFIFLLS